jgi:hypothetical protein
VLKNDSRLDVFIIYIVLFLLLHRIMMYFLLIQKKLEKNIVYNTRKHIIVVRFVQKIGMI